MPWRRLFVLLIILLLLAGAGAIAWRLLDLPPLGLAWKYGLTPAMGPTGQTQTIEGIVFVEIGPGCFRMGSTHRAEGGDFLGRICGRLGLPWGRQPESCDEMPVHWVEFARGFWMARTEVTNAQYERFDPGHERSELSPGDDHPVANVSWKDARRFCTWLSRKHGLPIRLPSESEWECACRAGSESEFYFGDDEEALGAYAWFVGNSSEATHEVATREPNVWGLFDLHGNVWEWCEDAWHDSYDDAPQDGSAWISGGTPFRVDRGGSWSIGAENCRSADRSGLPPLLRHRHLGFRLAFLPLPDS